MVGILSRFLLGPGLFSGVNSLLVLGSFSSSFLGMPIKLCIVSIKVWDTTSPPSSSLIAHDGSEAIHWPKWDVFFEGDSSVNESPILGLKRKLGIARNGVDRMMLLMLPVWHLTLSVVFYMSFAEWSGNWSDQSLKLPKSQSWLPIGFARQLLVAPCLWSVAVPPGSGQPSGTRNNGC